MNFNIQLVLFAFVIFMVGITKSDDPIGPADITIERIEECEEPDKYLKQMDVSMSKLNRTHAGFTGCLIVDSEFGETSTLNITAAKWGDGGWKPNALNLVQKSACESLNKHVNDPWQAVLKASGNEGLPCPLPKGNYCVEKLSMELDGLFPNMLYGKFRVDTTFIIDDEEVLCIRAFINSEPTKSAKKPY